MERRVISGPPKLALMAGAIAAGVGAFSVLAWPNLEAISFSIVGLIAAWRLLQIAVFVENDELVIRNLFATVRLPIADAEVHMAETDLRTRTAWGGQYLPENAVPKMADDNMQTKARLIRVRRKSNPSESTHLDASLGIFSGTQKALYTSLHNAIG